MTRSALWVVAGLTVVGALLRLWGIGSSLWLDELHVAWAVSGELAEIAPRARIGNFPPLFFWLVAASTKLFGLTEPGVRMVSLVAGVALIPAAYGFAARLTRSGAAGAIAALVVALDPNLFGWYSQEARPYALIQLVALLHFWTLYELSRRPRAALRACWVAATVVLFYLHYTTLVILSGELAWLLWRSRGAEPLAYRGRPLALDLGLAAVLCLPGADHLIEIAGSRGAWEQFVSHHPPQAILQFFPLAGWAGAACALAAGVAYARRERRIDRETAVLLACWFGVPVVLAWLASALDLARLFHPRYLMTTVAALPIAVGWAAAALPGWKTRAALALAITALLLLQPPQRVGPGTPIADFERDRYILHGPEDWRSAVQHVRDHDPDGRFPVLLWSGVIESRELPRRRDDEAFREYLLYPITGIYDLAGMRRLLPLAAGTAPILTPSDVEHVRQAGGAWFLFQGRVRRDIIAVMRSELARAGLPMRVADAPPTRGLVVFLLLGDEGEGMARK